MGSKRRVLVVAYHFPPVGGAGVQRTVGFTSNLAEHGWQPVVVTGPRGDALEAAGMLDESLADRLPEDVEILRVARPEPAPPSLWRARADRVVRLRSGWHRWWVSEVVALGRELDRIDLVYASLSPYESALAARSLADAHHVPWIADLRDPWALDEMQTFPTRVHRRLELGRMRRILRSADGVVANTEEAARELRALLGDPPGRRIVTIPNGFDARDFAGEAPNVSSDSFRIVFTGGAFAVLGERHARRGVLRRLAGGSTKGVDLTPRTHVPLLEAVELLLARRPELAPYLGVHIAGMAHEADVKRLDETPFVRFHGYVPHHESIALIRSADALFLPLHGLADGHRANTVPGKTYEYLAAGRPIVAAVPPGDAYDLLGEAWKGLVTRPGDAAAIARAIEALVDAKMRGEPPRAIDANVVARFDRRTQTGDLARLFADVASRSQTTGASGLPSQSTSRLRGRFPARSKRVTSRAPGDSQHVEQVTPRDQG